MESSELATGGSAIRAPGTKGSNGFINENADWSSKNDGLTIHKLIFHQPEMRNKTSRTSGFGHNQKVGIAPIMEISEDTMGFLWNLVFFPISLVKKWRIFCMDFQGRRAPARWPWFACGGRWMWLPVPQTHGRMCLKQCHKPPMTGNGL